MVRYGFGRRGAWLGFLLSTSLVAPSDAEPIWSWAEIECVGREELSGRDLSARLRRLVVSDRVTVEALRAALPRAVGELAQQGLLDLELRLEEPAGSAPRVSVLRAPRARWEAPRLRWVGHPDLSSDSIAIGRAAGEIRALEGSEFEPGTLPRVLERWVEIAAEQGHPYAVATVESLFVREASVRAGVRLETGPRVLVDELAFRGRRATRESHLRALVGFESGEAFRPSRWQGRERRLLRSGLFLSVGDPVIERLPGGATRVLLALEERRTNRVEGALGYDGPSERLSGTLALELGNLFGTGRSFRARWDRPRDDERRLQVAYREPLVLGSPLAAGVELAQELRDSTLDRARARLFAEAPLGADLLVSAGLEYERATLGVEPAEVRRREGTHVGARWERLRPDRFRGERLEITARAGTIRVRAPGERTRKLRFDRAEFLAERFEPWRAWIAHGRVLAAGIAGGAELSEVEAYRVGGARSLRGTAEDALFVRRYLLSQLELGRALGPNEVAYLFFDGGWVRRLHLGEPTDPQAGYGVGLRSETEARALQVDFGLRSGARMNEGRVHLSFESRF